MKPVLALILSLIPTLSFAAEPTSWQIECDFTEAQIEKQEARFTFNGKLEKLSATEAKISYGSALVLQPAEQNPEIWVSKAEDLANVEYKGRKYTDHFKFDLDWSRASKYNGSSGPELNLIIPKTPRKTSNGSRDVYIFDAVLDVSYDDHHGDYVHVECRD